MLTCENLERMMRDLLDNLALFAIVIVIFYIITTFVCVWGAYE